MKPKLMYVKQAISAIGLSCALGPALAAVSSFDSVAEFSGTQGLDGWQYGVYLNKGDTGSFTEFSTFGSLFMWGEPAWSEGTSVPPWTLLSAQYGHPSDLGSGGGADHDTVRRWTSGVAGTLTIEGLYGMIDSGSTALSIVVDGTTVWSTLTTSLQSDQSFTALATVLVGSQVDFVISSNGVDYNDSTRFTATGSVAAVPETGTSALLMAGLGVMAWLNRRRRTR